MDSAFDIVKAIIAGKRRGMIRPLQALEQDIAKEYTGDNLQADLDGLAIDVNTLPENPYEL